MDETIGSRLVALRTRASMSLAEVAKAAGYAGPSSIQSYFRADFEGPLGAMVAKKLAHALEGRGVPPIHRDEVFALVRLDLLAGENLDSAIDFEIARNERAPSGGGNLTRRNRGHSLVTLPIGHDDKFDIPRDLPSFSTKMEWRSGVTTVNDDDIVLEETEVDNGKIVSYFRRTPPLIHSDKSYIHYVQGTCMEPKFEEGEAILVDPRRPIKARDYVLVILSREERGGGQSEVISGILRRLIRRTPDFVELEQFNPPAVFHIPTAEIKDIVPVRPWVEVLDF